MNVTMTTIHVTILGGPSDGWSGRIRVPLQDEADGLVTLTGDKFLVARENAGVVFRVHRGEGRMLLVHPTAQGLFW
jgi:hypothetical protein